MRKNMDTRCNKNENHLLIFSSMLKKIILLLFFARCIMAAPVTVVPDADAMDVHVVSPVTDTVVLPSVVPDVGDAE